MNENKSNNADMTEQDAEISIILIQLNEVKKYDKLEEEIDEYKKMINKDVEEHKALSQKIE